MNHKLWMAGFLFFLAGNLWMALETGSAVSWFGVGMCTAGFMNSSADYLSER